MRCLAAIALLAGCYAPRPGLGAPCATGDVCPSGLTCDRSVCVLAVEPPDAGDGPDAASPSGFSVPQPIASLNTEDDEYGPTLTADGSLLIFTSNRSGEYTLYAARRAGAGFEAPVQITELDKLGEEYDPELAAAGTELVYVETAGVDGLRQATRSSGAAPWAGPGTRIGPGDDHEGPSLGVGDLVMVASSISDLDEYRRPAIDAPWMFARTHTRLEDTEVPALSADGLEIFVSDGQLYRATRASLDEEFGPPQRVRFGTPIDDATITDPELSADGRTLYLSIEIGTQHDLFVTTR